MLVITDTELKTLTYTGATQCHPLPVAGHLNIQSSW